MSLENEVKKNTAAVIALTEALVNNGAPAVDAVAPPVPTTAVTPAATVTPPVAGFAAPVMPPVVDAVAPPIAAGVKAPFTNAQEMVSYVSSVYQAVGQTHGDQLQAVMVDLKVTNINDVNESQYDALYAAIEAVKTQANG